MIMNEEEASEDEQAEEEDPASTQPGRAADEPGEGCHLADSEYS